MILTAAESRCLKGFKQFSLYSNQGLKVFTAQPKPGQSQIQGSKLPIGPIQPDLNLIGPKSSQANFKQVPVNQSESESE